MFCRVPDPAPPSRVDNGGLEADRQWPGNWPRLHQGYQYSPYAMRLAMRPNAATRKARVQLSLRVELVKPPHTVASIPQLL